MAYRTRTQYKTLYGTSGTVFPDNTTGEISESDMRAFGEDGADSIPFTADDSYSWPFPQATASGTNTYTATVSPAISAYFEASKYQIKFTNGSSGVSTLNLNSVGAKKIFINPTTQATTGHIVAGQIYILAYDEALDAAAGGFLIIGSGGGPGASAAEDVSFTPAGNIAATDVQAAIEELDTEVDSRIAAAVAGLIDLRGAFDASGGAYPSSGGSGSAGAILKGDAWVISVAGTLPTSQAVSVGDMIFALQDTPGNTQANWGRLEMNLMVATASVAGIGKLYTGTGSNTDGSMTQNAITTSLSAKQDLVNSATALVDGATIDLTAIKHTLTTSSATRTFTISYTGDEITLEVTLNATSSVFTFPETSLCVSEGIASGDNTCPLAGVSGDKYVFALKKVESAYYVVAKNFGQ